MISTENKFFLLNVMAMKHCVCVCVPTHTCADAAVCAGARVSVCVHNAKESDSANEASQSQC